MTAAVTLTAHRTTLSGAINAYSQVEILNKHTYGAAVFGPAGTSFDLINQASITDDGAGRYSAGILLATAGTILNRGDITSKGEGILLQGGGTVTNSATIRATRGGIDLGAAGTVINRGTIASADSYGIRIWAGNVTNSGKITATGDGIVSTGDGLIPTGQLTVVNTGIIATTYGNDIVLQDGGTVDNTGTLFGLTGIVITAGGTVDNAGLISTHAGGSGVFLVNGGKVDNSGTILASQGIHLGFGPTALVENTGLIAAKYFDGVFLAGAGTVDNAGRIRGYLDGVYLDGGGLLTNAGSIAANGAASGYGVDLWGTATVTNTGTITGDVAILAHGDTTIDNAGLITGQAIAIDLEGGGTLINSGTIAATGTAIAFADGANNRLIITNRSRITGAVDGGGGVLEFAANTAASTFTAAEAAQFTNFSSLQIDHGALWAFAGDLTLATPDPLLNDGTFKQFTGATIAIETALTGTGAVELAHGRLTLANTVASTQTIDFTGTGETLALADPESFSARIKNFTLGDTIDLTGISPAAITATHFAAGILTLDEGDIKLEFTFANPASFGTETFALTAAGSGTAITLAPAAAALLPVTHVTTLTPLATFS